MNKALFLLLALLGLSCQQQEATFTEKDAAKINNVSVIIDDLLWDGEIGDSIRNKFASPVIGLPQEEPLFTLSQYPVTLLEGYMSHTRNIIVIKKENRNRFEVREDQFTMPQNVIYISGKTIGDIIDIIEKNAPTIIARFRNGEIAYTQTMFGKSLLDHQQLTKKFEISLLVPSDFHYALTDRNFIWIRKEIPSGNTSIVVYDVPLETVLKNNDIANNIIRMRDSVTGLYIKGAHSGTAMVIENSYTPYFFTTEINNNPVFEIRGTWELDRNMSGPFFTYCVRDDINKRFVVIDGFCYLPSKHKRDLMLELEAIAKSIHFLDIKNDPQ